MVVPRSVPPSGCIMMLSFVGKNLAGFCSLPAPRQCLWWCFTQELVVGIHWVRISWAKDFVAFPAVTLSARRPAPRGWCGHLRPMPIYYGQAAPGSLSLFFLALPDHVARVPCSCGEVLVSPVGREICEAGCGPALVGAKEPELGLL